MNRLFISVLLLLFALSIGAQTRTEQVLKDWQFRQNDKPWCAVTVPHDWAISGPFDKKWDLQVVAIKENGEQTATEKSGRSGSLPWIGSGEYRTMVAVPAGCEYAELLFDGAMSEPQVYVNGKLAGQWNYGYNTFKVDITPYINADGSDNEILVKLTNLEESSRWYPGAGLYRPVTLITTAKTHIATWGTMLRTSSINRQLRGGVAMQDAVIVADTQLEGEATGLSVSTIITDRQGEEVARAVSKVEHDMRTRAVLNIVNAQTWTPERPYLYNVRTEVWQGDKLIDSKTEKLGVRTIAYSSAAGFQLNGETRKFKGVCLHHDLGPLGAAVNKAALARQIRIMKDMGADAIRTSHNMPSQWQMEVCDSLGMMVMAESFDSWKDAKCRNGYNRFWDTAWEVDITNLILANRNHPSIVMWSVGNEIPEQWKREGAERLRKLVSLCHELDPTRPVTCGSDQPDATAWSGFSDALDVVGYNYRVHRYDDVFTQLHQGFLLGSETASTVSSRGVYKFPVEVKSNKAYDDGQCSSYDTEYCWWSNLPDNDFEIQDDRDWTIGQFVWTGFDYLGEPTPYDEFWPSRSSYFGICDLAGLPKDRYYLYRSVWNKSEHTIHLLPHWTWPDRVGEVTPVYCYTDYPEAELFVNGKSQGRIRKQSDAKTQYNGQPAIASLDRYRLRWNDVRYEPGELKVVCYNSRGNVAGEQVIHTAGKPAKLWLNVDRPVLKADGEDLAYITVTMVDADGNMVPYCQDRLRVDVKGAGSFRGICNGDATSLEVFTQPQMRLFNGQLVVTVQANCDPGKMQVVVTDTENKRIKASTTIITE